MTSVRRVLCCMLVWVAVAADTAAARDREAVATEPEPIVDSAALVQPALLSGPGYQIAPQVPLHGYMARFTLTTPYGELHPESVELLAVREAEIPAIEALERASKADAFAHALAQRGTKAGTALWNVIAHPIDTLTGLPQGVARYFGKKIASYRKRAVALSDRANREFEHSGDPYAPADGPLTAARPPLPDEPAKPKRNKAWYARAGSEGMREVKRHVDYSKMRREMSKVLELDPYTTNPLINARLDALAWAAVAGNFSGGAVLDTVTGTAGRVLSTTGRLNGMVWDLDPEDLKEANRKRIAAYCADDFALRQFLRRGGFTDSLRTSLADGLDVLKPTRGCDDLIELAAATNSELEARYLVNALRLLQRHGVAPGGTLRVVGAAIAYETRDDFVLPLPVDRLSWTRQMAAFFDSSAFDGPHRTLLVGGAATQAAQRALTQLGWDLRLHAPYDGRPAYAEPRLTDESAETPHAACGAAAMALDHADPYLDADALAKSECRPL